MLSKIECLKIMELDAKANSYEIENRYTMLIKRYRGMNDPETMAKLDEITLAYNILTGRYVEPEPVDPRLEKVVLGKSRRQWRNIWHYGKWPFLAAVVGLFFLGYLIYSIATNEPPDFQLAVVGQFGAAEDSDERIDTYIKANYAGAEDIEVQMLPLDLRDTTQTSGSDGSDSYNSSSVDPQSQYAYVMKMMTLIAGDSVEVFLCDKPVFDQYAPQGVFTPLDDLYDRLQKTLPADVLAKIKPLRRQIDDSDSSDINLDETTQVETSSTEDAVNRDPTISIYGLDVTELQLTEGLGLYAENQILTIGFKADDEAKVEAFVEKWISDYELMHQQQQAYEDQLRAEASAQSSVQPTNS
ncbi:MAG: hypothetical protein VB070_09630 [Clostridiaceae bacterium]|nr:hypothetical protein [Clostridiaceae bacterium]